MVVSIANMFATANNDFSNGVHVSSRPLFLGLDVAILIKTIVVLFCSGLILWCLWDLWRRKDEDFDDNDFLDMLKDLTTQSYTLYISCLDHVNELDDLLENTVHKVSCRSRRQRKPRQQRSQDSYVDSSSGYSLTTEYDSEFDSVYDTASELDTKRKPSFSSKCHVELLADCKQCRSMHLCNNDGGRCVDIRVDTPESRNKTTTSSKTEDSFWPLNIMGSSDSISSFTSWSSLSSSTSSLSTLVSARSEMSEAIHAPPVVSKDEPCSTNKGPAGRSELNNPQSVELQGRHGLEHSIRKEATKRIPELVFNVEEEKHRPMVCDKVTDPEQHNAKTTFQKSLAMFEYLIKIEEKSFAKLSKVNTTDISWVAFNDQKAQKREKMDLLSKPQGNARPKRLVKKLVGPGIRIPITRVKHVLFIEKASIQLLEMNLKQKRLANVLGATTIFSKSMELITPEETPQPKEVTSSEVELELNCSKTLFISKEIRDKLEFHIKRKKIQHLWGLPQVVPKSIDALFPKAPKIDRSRVFPKPKYDIEVMTSDLPFLTDEQKEALEGNVRKKQAHKNWGYPKRIMDSLKAFEVPEGVAKDLDKRRRPGAKVQHPSAASKVKDIPVEPKEPQSSATSETNDLKEMSNKQQNNSHNLLESSTAKIQERGLPKVTFGHFSKKCFHSEYPVLKTFLKFGSNLNKYSLHKGSNVHRELIAGSTEGEGRDKASPSPQTQTTCLSEQPSVSTSRPCRKENLFFYH